MTRLENTREFLGKMMIALGHVISALRVIIFIYDKVTR